MFCPTCGQQQATGETRFCSRCGFPLTGTYELVANGGVLPTAASGGKKTDTPRKRGLKKGLFIFLLTFLVVPLVTLFTIAAGAEPFLVFASAILLAVGGLLRAAYAFMFESNELPEQSSLHGAPQFAQTMFGNKSGASALPPQQSIPASGYAPPAQSWRETNDLAAPPPSVTDSTTRLLQNQNDEN